MPTTPKKRYLSLNNTHMNSKKIKLKDIIKKSKNNRGLEEIFHKTHRVLSKLKNNHCLKFENYTSRKPLLKEIPYNTENDVELFGIFFNFKFLHEYCYMRNCQLVHDEKLFYSSYLNYQRLYLNIHLINLFDI